MLSDPYLTTSNINSRKSAVECNVKDFFNGFETFYHNVRAKKEPDLPHTICDPYGFALLCKDYERKKNKTVDCDMSCKDSFLNNIDTDYDSLYKFKFPFHVLLNLLSRAYLFDYELAMNIYNMQQNSFSIFNQIMNGHGYVINKNALQKKKVREVMVYASDSKLGLDEDSPINIPYKNRVCDGKSWPCIVSESYHKARLEYIDTNGYGTGLFLIGDNDLIYDVLKINDLWLIETPLQNRLKFGVSCRGYDVVPYMKTYSWRSTLKAARILECNKDDGILVRPCYENYFQTSWFEWSKNSTIYCCMINGKLQIANRKTSKPDFYTLEGDVAEVHPYERRVKERIWLDDFDIKEFQQILKLKGKICPK